VVKPGYVPDTGDIVWLYFDPQAGHEQSGHRPELVLSPARYNGPRGMMICCSMTSRIESYPFEVIDEDDPPSVVLADQVKSVDWRARRAERKGRVSPALLAEVRAKVRALLEL
jgi:mRNA interferase MazF